MNLVSRLFESKLDFWVNSLCTFVEEKEIKIEMSMLDYQNILKAQNSLFAPILDSQWLDGEVATSSVKVKEKKKYSGILKNGEESCLLGTDSRIIPRFDAFACFDFGEVDQSRKLVIKTSPFPFNVAIGSQEVVDFFQIHLDGSVNSEVAFSSLNKNVIKYHWETYYYLLLFQFLM